MDIFFNIAIIFLAVGTGGSGYSSGDSESFTWFCTWFSRYSLGNTFDGDLCVVNKGRLVTIHIDEFIKMFPLHPQGCARRPRLCDVLNCPK